MREQRLVLDPRSGLGQLFVRFHTGQIWDGAERALAKAELFGVRYGSGWDTTAAWAEVARLQAERASLHGKENA